MSRSTKCPTCHGTGRIEQPDGPTVLRGREIIDVAVTVVGVGEWIHYTDLLHRITVTGRVVNGEEPLETLLAALGRTERFEARGKRTGMYVRPGTKKS